MLRENRDASMENLERQLDVLETSLNSGGKPQYRAWLHTTTEHQNSHRNSPATSQVKDLAQEAEEMLQRSASRHRQENLFMETKIADLEGQRAKAQEREREREENRKRVMAFEQRVLQIEREREREQMQHVRDGQARDKEQAARLQQQQEVVKEQKRELETAARSLRQLQQEMQELEHELQHERRRLERQTMEALQLTQLLQERNVLIQTLTEEINGLKDLVTRQSVQIQTQQEHAQSALASNHALIFDREQEKREKEQIICAMRDLDRGLTAKYEDCASDLERAKQLNHNLHKAIEKSESESRELLVQLDLLRTRLSAAELGTSCISCICKGPYHM
jgi:DNA repair exonuclease SbcCD ATPase subunit